MIRLLAHGLGDASLLPVPLPFALVAAGAAVLGTAARQGRRSAPVPAATDRASAAGRPGTVGRGAGGATRGGGSSVAVPPVPPVVPEPAPPVPPAAPASGWLLPSWVTGVVDAPAFRAALRVLGLAGAAAVLWLAAFGPAGTDANPAPRLVLVVVWAGLVPLSFVAPGGWRAISPFRTLSGLLARAVGDPDGAGTRPLPAGIGWWPAAAGLAAFAALAGPLSPGPTGVLAFLVVYGLVQLAAATVYGTRWYAHGEALEVLAQVVGRLSPAGRDAEGRLRLGSPRARLRAPSPPGTVAVAGVLIGASLADFVADTPWWSRVLLGAPARPLVQLGLLVLAIGLATGLASAAVGARVLTPALLPLAAGYLFAHYFAVLLIEGQAALSQVGAVLAGDPAAQIVVNYDLLPGPLAATIQLLGFLVPHLVAVVVASDLAQARYGPRRAQAALAPFVGLTVLSVVAGTALRFAAG